MLIGASWPWNLSTVPAKTRGRPASAQARSIDADVRVVRGDDHDVVHRDRVREPMAVDPLRAAVHEVRDEAGDHLRLLVGVGGVARVGHGEVAQARATEDAGGVAGSVAADDDALPLEPVDGPEAARVERVRGEPADVGVEPPGLLEEQALLGVDRRPVRADVGGIGEQVRQRAALRAGRVRALRSAGPAAADRPGA